LVWRAIFARLTKRARMPVAALAHGLVPAGGVKGRLPPYDGGLLVIVAGVGLTVNAMFAVLITAPPSWNLPPSHRPCDDVQTSA